MALTIYRIEHLELVQIPESCHGQFYTGDSYVIVKTDETTTPAIHFWIGAKTSIDEQTVAAYKTVELDERTFNGQAVEYREVQGFESPTFRSYFFHSKRTNDLVYLSGGVSSGLVHVTLGAGVVSDRSGPRLFCLSGEPSRGRDVRLTQVPLSTSSLNDRHVFILDVMSPSTTTTTTTTNHSRGHLDKTLLFLAGSRTSSVTKAKGVFQMTRLRDMDGRPKDCCVILSEDGGGEEAHSDDLMCFWSTILGQDMDNDATMPRLSDFNHSVDQDAPSSLPLHHHHHVQLFRLHIEDTTEDQEPLAEVEITNVTPDPASGYLTRDLLSSSDVYILDTGLEVFLWIGQDASAHERRRGMIYAVAYLDQNTQHHSKHQSITRLVQHTETYVFCSYFHEWHEVMNVNSVSDTTDDDDDANAPPRTPVIDFQAIHAVKAECDSDTIVSNIGPGVILSIHRIASMKAEALEPRDYGSFYSGDSYVVVFRPDTSGPTLVYYWLGIHTSVDEQTLSAILAVEIDQSQFQGAAVQVRVCQGKEPRHFRSLFHGQMIIRHGDFDDDSSEKSTSLFHVRGLDRDSVCSIEIEAPQSSALNSSDCFIVLHRLDSDSAVEASIWKGQYALDIELDLAKACAARLCPDLPLNIIEEGHEPDTFWNPLGGRQVYYTQPPASTASQFKQPKLFQCSNVSGNFQVDPVWQFTQQDLTCDDSYLLDTGEALYLWIGEQSNVSEQAAALNFAQSYLDSVPDGRDLECPVTIVQCRHEPLFFTAHFQSWEPSWFDQLTFSDPYEDRRAQLEKEQREARESREKLAQEKANLRAQQIAQAEAEAEEREKAEAEAEEREKAEAVAKADAERAEAFAEAEEREKAEAIAKAEAAQLAQEELARAEKAELKTEKQVHSSTSTASSSSSSSPKWYTLEELQLNHGTDIGVDLHKKEAYLSPPDFEQAFGMTHLEFQKLPKWKQQAKKKDLHIF